MDSSKQQSLFSEANFINPLVEILEAKPTQLSKTESIAPSVKKSLDDLFPEQQYAEKEVKRAKQILGDLVNEFTDEELKDTVTKIQFLANSWLDEFERKIFEGTTLKELLHEKGEAK